MSTIDEKFQKVIADKKASPEGTIKEDAAVGDAAIKKGAVPAQQSDLKNDAIEVGGSTKESIGKFVGIILDLFGIFVVLFLSIF